MGNTNNSLRIRTNVGEDKFITFNLDSEYDTLEILSLKINQRGAYRYHTSTYGVVVGRVLANNGFGVPNAKLSLFIAKDENADVIENAIYPYTTVGSKNSDGIRYNLLPSNQKDDCHQVVGTFPSKRMILDDNSVLEVFDKYYVYTTRTNEAGDYMFFGVPTGTYNLHMDLDISDCGKLSQRPRDFIYKGYSLDQFQSANQFKIDTELSSLSQIFTQDTTIEVKPFWGDEDEGTNIGITREDINVNYTFEPTCVFMGSIVSDNPNEGISKRCVPTNKMGDMRELVTGSGTIEILRKKIDNTIEELEIKGTQLIDGNGVWCFQIPMNLDYVMTDEYGNMVPTDDPEKGIPTRCEVRFRISMDETQSEGIPYKRGKVLVPNNPENGNDVDYEFGSKTKDSSFKSLMWNNVYSVKSFIPRFQKARNIKTNKFTGIKNVNINGGNNPMPYNNIRIKIPFMFWLICNIVKLFIRIIQIINKLKVALMSATLDLVNLPYAYISNELCPDLEYWYFAPGMHTDAPHVTWLRKAWDWVAFWRKEPTVCDKWQHESVCKTFKEIHSDITSDEGVNPAKVDLYYFFGTPTETTYGDFVLTEEEFSEQIPKNTGTPTDLTGYDINRVQQLQPSAGEKLSYYSRGNWYKCSAEIAIYAEHDKMSTEVKNRLTEIKPRIHLTPDVDYLMQCVEMSLAQEYEVIKFDFYNDWINGTIYLPRWARDVKYKRRRRQGKKVIIEKVKGCINDVKRSRVSRRYMQQCSLQYEGTSMNIHKEMPNGCNNNGGSLKCHKKQGSEYISIFGRNSGAVQEQLTMLGDYVYYMKPKEGKVLLFATDIIMLGTLFDCNEYGLPSTFESLMSTTYKMPMNMALTNTENDSYSYFDDENYLDIDMDKPGQADTDFSKQLRAPTLDDIEGWKCGEVCSLDYTSLSGATPAIPSYQEIDNMLEEYEKMGSVTNTEEPIAIEYEDIFPITEMSGIEWGYTGPGQGEPNPDKMYAPGGHFMGLACGNAETNIRSCVNLKRACEIGTTLSEHFSIPIGYKNFENGGFHTVKEGGNYDVVNYLYVSPNGLISKDQVIDVTFRSAFATMNQNSLETITDPVTRHKKYKFEHLIPDSFDGCLQNKLNSNTLERKYNQRIPQEWDEYWDTYSADRNFVEFFKNDVVLEHGYTINRLLETRSDDYIKFRHGEPEFLKGEDKKYSMPIYRNSFYFYFGLKQGLTALDEFRRQFFAPCAKSVLVADESNITCKEIIIGGKFEYNIEVIIKNMSPMFSYVLTRSEDSKEKNNSGDITGENISTDNFIIEKVPIGRYYLKVIDSTGTETGTEIVVGVNNYSVDVNLNSVKNYINKVTSGTVYERNQTNGGTIDGTFALTTYISELDNYQYNVEVRKGSTKIVASVTNNEWTKLYDGDLKRLWLFGPGIYNVYITVDVPDGSDEYLYCSFEVKDGVAPAEIYLTDISSKYVFGYNELKYITDIEWKRPEEFGESEFKWYKALVNPNKFGKLFHLGLGYSGDTANSFVSVLGGKGEQYTNMSYQVGDKVTLSTEVGANYNLGLNIYVGSNMENRGRFYYTAYNGNNKTFASEYVTGKVTNSNEIQINGSGTLPKSGYLCLEHSDGKNIIKATVSNGIISSEERLNLADGVEVKVADMVSLPVYVYPFAFRTIMGMFYNTHAKTTSNIRYLTGTTGNGGGNYTQCFRNKLTSNDYNISSDNKLTVYEHCSDINYAKSYLAKQTFEIPSFNGVLKYAHRADEKNINFRIFRINENLKDTAKYYVTSSQQEGQYLGGLLCFNGMTTEDGLDYGTVTTALSGGDDNNLVQKMKVENGNGEQYAESSMSPQQAKNVWAYGMVSTTYGEQKNQCQFNDFQENIFVHTFASDSNMGMFNFTEVKVFGGKEGCTTITHDYQDGNMQDGKPTYKLYEWVKNDEDNKGEIKLLLFDGDGKNKYVFDTLKLTNTRSTFSRVEVSTASDKYRYDIIQKYEDKTPQTSDSWPTKMEYEGFTTYVFSQVTGDNNTSFLDTLTIKFNYGDGFVWSKTVIEGDSADKKKEIQKIQGTFYPVIVAYLPKEDIEEGADDFDVENIIASHEFISETLIVIPWGEKNDFPEKVKFKILYVYNYNDWGYDETDANNGGGNSGGGNSGGNEEKTITLLVTPMGNKDGVCNKLSIQMTITKADAETIEVVISYDNEEIKKAPLTGEVTIVELDNSIENFDRSKLKITSKYTTYCTVLDLDIEADSEETPPQEPEVPTE